MKYIYTGLKYYTEDLLRFMIEIQRDHTINQQLAKYHQKKNK